MENQEIINTLSQYKSDFEGILSRFIHSRKRIDIDRKDDPIYRQKVLEVIDFLNDHLGQNQYSRMISTHFNSGISNYFRTPSYKSVENIIGILGAAITRLDRELGLLGRTKAKRAPFSWRKTTPKEKKDSEKWYQSRTIQAALITGVFMLVAALFTSPVWVPLIRESRSTSDSSKNISTEIKTSSDFPVTTAEEPNSTATINENSHEAKQLQVKPPPLIKRDEAAIEPEMEKQESKSICEPGAALLEIFKIDPDKREIPDLPVIRTYWKKDLVCSGGFLLPDRVSEIGRKSPYFARFSFYYEAKESGKYGFTVATKKLSHTEWAFGGYVGAGYRLVIGGVEILKGGAQGAHQGVCELKEGFHRIQFEVVTEESSVQPRFHVTVLTPGALDAVPLTKDMMLLKKE